MRSKPLTLISINLLHTIMARCEICTRTLQLFLKEFPCQHQFYGQNQYQSRNGFFLRRPRFLRTSIANNMQIARGLFMLFHLRDLKIKCIFLCIILPDVQFTDKFSTHRLSGPQTSFLGLLYSHSLPTTCISSSQKLTQVYKQSFIYKTVIIYSVMFQSCFPFH